MPGAADEDRLRGSQLRRARQGARQRGPRRAAPLLQAAERPARSERRDRPAAARASASSTRRSSASSSAAARATSARRTRSRTCSATRASNDVTARDLQKKDGQWTRAKGFDTFCPVGPWIETELDPLRGVAVRCRVNEATRQDGLTTQMIFDVPTLVAYVSRMHDPRARRSDRDGTPEGVGPLADGDAVEVEVSGIGILRSRVALPAK